MRAATAQPTAPAAVLSSTSAARPTDKSRTRNTSWFRARALMRRPDIKATTINGAGVTSLAAHRTATASRPDAPITQIKARKHRRNSSSHRVAYSACSSLGPSSRNRSAVRAITGAGDSTEPLKEARMRMRHAIVLLGLIWPGCAYAQDFRIEDVPSARNVNAAQLKPGTIEFSDQTGTGAVDSET